MINRRVFAAAATAALLLVSSAAYAVDARDPFGPPFGSNNVSSEIGSLTPRADTDDYTAELMAGESFSVSITAGKKTELLPLITVLDPSGADRTGDVGLKSQKKGAKVSFKPFAADMTGGWTVRFSGENDTTGTYAAKFKIKKPKATKDKGTLAGPDGRLIVPVDLVDGSLVDVSASWKKKGAALELIDVRDPTGQTVPGIVGANDTALSLKKTKIQLKKFLMNFGTGTYEFEFRVVDGESKYSISVKRIPPVRPKGKTPIVGANDPHLDPQPTPKRSAADQPVKITGRNFALAPPPRVFFGPFEAVVAATDDEPAVGPARNFINVIVPPGADGEIQDVLVVNPDGQSTFHPDYIIYVAEAVIDSVEIISGEVLGTNEVLRVGGPVLEIKGRNFLLADSARVGGQIVARTNFSDTSFQVTVPASGAGLASFTLTDEFGRVQTVPDVVRYVGFEHATTSMGPGADSVDDLSAYDGAIGDLDLDGRADDLVFVTYNHTNRLAPEYVDPGYSLEQVTENLTGSRGTYTRLFLHEGNGVLVDRTASNIPALGTDASTFGDWNARGVAIGDLDGKNGPEIVLAGGKGEGDTSATFRRIHVMTNNGSGNFTLDESIAPPLLFTDSYLAVDERYVVPDPDDEEPDLTGLYLVQGRRKGPETLHTIALGDLDMDGDLEIVAGEAGFTYRYVNIDPGPVDTSVDPPYIPSTSVTYVQTGYYFSGTRIFDNDIANGNGFDDVTEARMPTVGTKANNTNPAFPARHIVLGDIDQDTYLDMVITWNNPASLIPASAIDSYGAYQPFTFGKYSYRFDATTAQEVVATRVLINDQSGGFTDETATWMPAGVFPEFFQGHRCVLEDLDCDGDLDLVIGHRRSLNEYRNETAVYDRSSLRILRNDDGESFTDVTATALPTLAGGAGGVLRGRAIAVADIDGNGKPEIVVGADEALDDGSGNAVRSTRVLWNFSTGAGLSFEFNEPFEPAFGVDTGEAHALLIGDLDFDGLPGLVYLTETLPGLSDSESGEPGQGALTREFLRFFNWVR